MNYLKINKDTKKVVEARSTTPYPDEVGFLSVSREDVPSCCAGGKMDGDTFTPLSTEKKHLLLVNDVTAEITSYTYAVDASTPGHTCVAFKDLVDFYAEFSLGDPFPENVQEMVGGTLINDVYKKPAPVPKSKRELSQEAVEAIDASKITDPNLKAVIELLQQ